MSNLGKTYTVDPSFREKLKEPTSKARYDNVNLDPTSRISPFCNLVGSIYVGARSAILAGCVLRADFEPITIGEDTVIEDSVTMHGGLGHPINIGEHCAIGHKCMLHGCSIGDNCLIGMSSTLMNDVEVGNNCIIGAGSLLPQGFKVPDRWMAFGHPAKLIRELSDKEIEELITIGGESYSLLTERMLEAGVLENPTPELMKKIGQ